MNIFGQFEIGHVYGTYVDASRNDRNVTYEAYYPADNGGDNAICSSGEFPLIIFGHGFVMGFGAYQNIWEFLVPEGYVMVFVTTESGIAPSHESFGLDLSFISQEVLAEGNTTGSIFENHLNNRFAFAGHSMGGGATWLAAAVNSNVNCIVGLAPAETNPSAIDAAVLVTAPVMVLSGSSDNVTPPAENHIPIFDNSSSECKVFVNLVDGSHCGYANAGSLCDFGELGFSGMAREEQQSFTHDLMLAFFDYHLKEMAEAWQIILGYDELHTEVELEISCTIGVNQLSKKNALEIWPNPAADFLNIQFPEGLNAATLNIELIDIYGRVQLSSLGFKNNSKGQIKLVIENITAGVYMVQIRDCASNIVIGTKRIVLQ